MLNVDATVLILILQIRFSPFEIVREQVAFGRNVFEMEANLL